MNCDGKMGSTEAKEREWVCMGRLCMVAHGSRYRGTMWRVYCKGLCLPPVYVRLKFLLN